MAGQYVIATVGAVGFSVASLGAFLRLWHRPGWSPLIVRVAALVAVGLNAVYLLWSISTLGLRDTLGRDYEPALLLATLIGLMAIGTHLASTLRGLDAFLLVVAAAVELLALTAANRPAGVGTTQAWFVSHGLAFAVSGALFVAGGAAGATYLLASTMLRSKKRLTLFGTVAPLESLERFGRWMLIIGFPLFTYGVLTGICGIAHRKDLRSVWMSDPTVLLSFAAWAVYGYLLYALLFRPEVRGRRAATWSTYGLALVVVVFLVREFLSPLHR